jgi:hypothetical protein
MAVLVGSSTTTGYATNASANSNTGTRLVVYPFTAGSTGTAADLYFYSRGDAINCKFVIYDSSYNLLGYTGTVALNAGGWVSGALNTSVSVTSGQTYYLGFWTESGYTPYYTDSGGTCSTYSTGGGNGYTSPQTYTSITLTGDAGISRFLMYADGTVGGAAPTITDAGDGTFTNGETGIVITGTNFGASQGTGSVKISPTDNVADAGAITQTVTAWGATSVTITAVRSTLALNTPCYLFVTADGNYTNASGLPVSFYTVGDTYRRFGPQDAQRVMLTL